jgi:hypothetical protein
MPARIRPALLGVTAALAAFPAVAQAEERVCRGTIGAASLDNIRVPQGATCTLNGTYAKGTVKVERGATLKAYGVRVIGNVQGENARQVNVLSSSRVGGSVQVVQGGGATISRSRVTGDIQFDANTRPLRALSNTVGGSIQIVKNLGGVEVRNNRIDGNLQCKENSPAPFGGGNIVQGSKEDQCARL